jgi:hypothetical protein
MKVFIMINENEKKDWKQPEWKAVKTSDLTKATGTNGSDGGLAGSTLT